MYDYIKLKKNENNKNTSFFFKKWQKCNKEDFVNEDIIWLSDNGETYCKEFDASDTHFFIKNTYYHLQSGERLERENITKNINSKSNYCFYKLKTGNDVTFFIRINKNLLTDNEEKNYNLLMFNFYRYLFELNIISNTIFDDQRNQLIMIKNQIQNKKVYFLSEEIINTKINKVPEQLVHWVWFRKNNKKLTPEISERAMSWIAINPNAYFHLWTNLKNSDEWIEFLSEIADEIKKIFLDKIIIHYNDETMGLTLKVMQEYKNNEYYDEESYQLLYDEFMSTYKNALIFKTDIIRLMILYEYGGVYTDFNDCLCLSPIKNIFAIHDINKPLGVSDSNDLNHASNYFLYSPKGSDHWKMIMFEMMQNAKHIVWFLKNNEMKENVINLCLKLIELMTKDDFCIRDDIDAYNNLDRIYEDKFKKLPYLGDKVKPITLYYWRIFFYSIILDMLEDNNSKETIRSLLMEVKKKSKKNKNDVQRIYPKIFFDIEKFNEKFDKAYNFWWTDYNLNAIMHFTNLPIYCRMRKHEIYLLPYGYYYRYGCLVSWVGHLGDGGSYGFEDRGKFIAKNIYR